MKLTGAAMLVSRGIKVFQAAPAAYPYRSATEGVAVVDEQTDPYWRLRPIAPTLEDDVCQCSPDTAVVLRDVLTDNPLGCVACNGEVAPERLGFDAQFAEEIADWLSVYDSLYRLWLDSGEYEAWAKARLSDPQGQVNRTGREIVARLNELVPAFYWWFVDTDATEAQQPITCPFCSGPLKDYEGRNFRTCPACRVLV